MGIFDILSLATRMFQNRPLRTFLTILGVGVGIGAVLFLVSLGYGIQNTILGRITSEESLLSLDVAAGADEIISLNNESIGQISKVDFVEKVSSIVSISGQISIDQVTGDGVINIVDPDYFKLSGISSKEGALFQAYEKNEVAISSAGVSLLNIKNSEAIGKKVNLVLFLSKISEDGFEEIEIVKHAVEYEITAVIEDENTNFVYVPSGTLGDIKFEKYDGLKVKVVDENHLDEVRKTIINKGFLVSSLSDTIEQAKKIFRVIQIVLALFGLIALIVSAIGMFNTMTIALLERTNEIGIMRAIGVTKRDIRKIFLLESILMGFLGGIMGVLIGFGAGEIANVGLNFLANNFGGQPIDIFYRPTWFILVIIGFSTTIGFFTGVYPSIRASKLNPLEALRYK